jgi:hypothetical protein
MFAHDVTKEPPAAQPPEKIFRHESDVKSAPACGAKTKKPGGAFPPPGPFRIVYVALCGKAVTGFGGRIHKQVPMVLPEQSVSTETGGFRNGNRRHGRKRLSAWATQQTMEFISERTLSHPSDQPLPLKKRTASGSRPRNSRREQDGKRRQVPRRVSEGSGSQGAEAATPGP